ncbi:MAG: D-alanyl-D-alanine carboxypeptidase/D-alanyl-D-alanine-endopeptidase [Chthonomonadales bacterium]
MKSFRISCFAISLLGLASYCFAQDSIESQVEKLLANPGLKGGIQGIVIESLKTGKVLCEHNPDLHFVPASNNKLLTATATLALLGPEYAYHTRLLAAKPISDGKIDGDLYLKGSGDPILLFADIDGLAEKLKALGVKSISGNIVADSSRFDNKVYGFGWEWDDMPFYYSAQVSGLNLNENMATITVTPGKKVGDSVKTVVAPLPDEFEVINKGTTGVKGSPDSIAVTRVLGKNLLVITGSVAVDKKQDKKSTISITVEDPPLYAASYLALKLKQAGIRCKKVVEGIAPENAELLAETVSPPLSVVLARMNKPSDNLIAECMLKTLGAEMGSKHIGSTEIGRDASMAWYKAHGVDTGAIHMVDGSGLSRHNLVSPRAYCQMLKAAYKLPTFKTLYDSLPIVGVDGTAKNRLKGTLAQGNSHIKDGYVQFASSLSGYVKNRNGEELVFVMFMNNHTTSNSVPTAVQDAILRLLSESKSEP